MINTLSQLAIFLITLWIGAKGYTVYYKEALTNLKEGTNNEQTR